MYTRPAGRPGRRCGCSTPSEDWQWWARCLATTYRAAGIGPGDRVALAFSFGPHVQFWDARDGLERVGAMALTLGGMSSVQRLQTIAQVEATALVCTPSYALRLYEVAVEEDLEGALVSLQKVICAGEPGASLPGACGRGSRKASACACFDHAGLTETGPFGYPCAEGGGLHINADEFVCEILDADCARRRPASAASSCSRRSGAAAGRCCATAPATSWSQPERPCPAGHEHPWLPGGIVGRTDDMVVIRGMNVYPSAIEQAVRDASESGEFRLTFYTEPGGMDEVKLEVELARGATARTLQDVMRQQLGLRVRVVPVGPGVLPRTEGKARRVTRPARERGRGERRAPRRPQGSAAPASRSPRRSSTTSSARASGRATSSAARRTSRTSSASAARRCARHSRCSPAAT